MFRASRHHLAVLLAVATCAVYASGLSAWYFQDDFRYFFVFGDNSPFSEFVRANPENPTFWRPVQSTLLAWQQRLSGHATWPCHALQLVMHLLLSLVVYLIARRLTERTVPAFLAAAFCALAHVGAQTVVGVDTLSQGGSTLLLATAVMLLLQLEPGVGIGGLLGSRHYLGALGCFGAAMLMKESGVSGLPVLALVLVASFPRADRRLSGRRALFRLGAALAPFIVVFFAYYSWRSSIVVPELEHPERYAFSIGANLPRNVALLLMAVLVPVSPHRIVEWWHQDEGAKLLVTFVLLMVVMSAVLWGLLRDRRTLVAGIAVAAFLATLPAILLQRVTEVYAYNLLPGLALLVGIGLGQLMVPSASTFKIGLARIVIVGLLVANVFALREKVALMVGNGQFARSLYLQMVQTVRRSPPGAELFFIDPLPDVRRYSVILIPASFGVVGGALDRIRAEAGRTDARMYILDEPSAFPGGHAYTLSSGKVVSLDGMRHEGSQDP